ncbi:toprim domain-containing protein [Mycoplasma enhydrae]|uniref:toprim domain-containing protein n=1 Tax=Mycoplasma enhydrae TaxID=2499220 RepID=UPI0021E74BC4|nr:toprim domain-containing protein [Mycoplasma enhydrae]MCV3733569.1 toprim domain-containing protein [Mycoplasma enhydrae]MCV3753455.1 toprim domain-containing protein [Mycoplasma enhydrae]
MDKKIDEIVGLLKKIPGISIRQANKIINFFLDNDVDESKELFNKIIELASQTTKCIQCLAYTNKELCDICSDKSRQKKLYVVSTNNDINKFEQLDIPKGKYFIFNELVDLKNVSEKFELKLKKLFELSKQFDEIILALNSDFNGQITMRYIEKKLRDELKYYNVYQLSIGIPFGMSIDAVDLITLKQSILNKKKIN